MLRCFLDSLPLLGPVTTPSKLLSRTRPTDNNHRSQHFVAGDSSRGQQSKIPTRKALSGNSNSSPARTSDSAQPRIPLPSRRWCHRRRRSRFAGCPGRLLLSPPIVLPAHRLGGDSLASTCRKSIVRNGRSLTIISTVEYHRSNQSMKPTPPLRLRLRLTPLFCLEWRGGLSFSR